MLYFVATPIGNLKDISLRALEVLNFVDIIACEDTRKSLILLNHYGIKKRLISYHKNNEKISAEGILKLLQQGKNIAVISDSGMPVISDPGSVLIDVLKKNNQPYSVIPGANASLSALILSGLNSKSFSFFGFLPEKNKDRIEFLNSIKNYTTTLIFYVSPHNLLKDISLIYNVLGSRNACLVNEITKMFEKSINFNLKDFQELNIQPKGEYVLVVEGLLQKTENNNTNLSLHEQVEYFVKNGLSKKEALKKVAKNNNIKNIYKIFNTNLNE